MAAHTLHPISDIQIRLLRQARDEMEQALEGLRGIKNFDALCQTVGPRLDLAHATGILTGWLRSFDEVAP